MITFATRRKTMEDEKYSTWSIPGYHLSLPSISDTNNLLTKPVFSEADGNSDGLSSYDPEHSPRK